MLCSKGEAKECSHIIPKFVYEWLKKIGPTPFLRATGSPNKRIQDGTKVPLLCESCEDRFSVWEKAFSEKVFRKIHHEARDVMAIHYGAWLLKFAASVSWRSLTYLKMTHGLPDLSHQHKVRVEAALQAWARFLLDETQHPGCYEQHLLIMGPVESAFGIENSPDLSLYLSDGIEFNTVHSPSEVYIFTKMCKVVVCGVILNDDPKVKWKGTKIHVRNGHYYSPGDFQVSSRLRTLIKTGVQRLRDARKTISPAQKQTMEKSFQKTQGLPPGQS